MNTKTKALIGMMIALMAAIPIVSYTMAGPSSTFLNDSANSDNSATTQEMEQSRTMIQERSRGARFFRGAEKVTVEGMVDAYYKQIIVVQSGEEKLNILLPATWSVGSEIYNVTQLFEQGILASGQNVSIQALQRTTTNENGVTIRVILAYEIAAGETNIHAILPFNISP